MIDCPQPTVLHACSPRITPLQEPEYSETFTADVTQYPNSAPPPLKGRVVVSLGSDDGDGCINQYWDFDPDTAVELAEQLLHNAAIAREFNARAN
jgi:hypothetical protein